MTASGASALPPGEQPKQPEGVIVIKESLRKYWHFGLVAALLVVCAGSFLAFKKRNMYVYGVMAKVYLAPRFATVLSEQKETDIDSFQKLRQFQEQQALLVKSYEVAMETLKILNMNRKEEGKPLIWITEDIPVNETPLINEVRTLTEKWKTSLRLEEGKRLEELRKKIGGSSDADDADQSLDESFDEEELERAQKERPEHPELLDAKKRLKAAQDKNEEMLRKPAEDLAGSIQSALIKDTYLMNVSLELTMDKRKLMPLDEIVNAVVKVYIDKSKSTTFYTNKDVRMALLNARREQLMKKINRRMTLRTVIAQELGVTTFSENTVNPFDSLLLDTKRAKDVAERDLIVARSAKLVFEDEQGHENREALEAASAEIVANDPTLNTLKGNVNLRRTQLLKEVSGLEDNHPLKKNIDRELKEADEELNRGTQEVTRRVGRMLILQRKNDVAKAKGIVDGINQQINENQAKAKQFSLKYNLALGYSNEIARFQAQLEEIELRKDKLMMEIYAPGMARPESWALPAIQGKGGWKKMAGITVVASFLIGLILPIAIDLLKFKLSGQIRSVNQVQNILGIRPLAGLYEPNDNISRRLIMGDIKRRLAIALEREHQLQGTRLFMLTSVNVGAGVTSVALELALEFGDLGVKAVVVEVNAAKPDRRYHGDHLQTGLIDLITGEGVLAEVIAKADGLLPDRICIGGYHVHSHLFGYAKLREILVELRRLYQVILLDAPPILSSADPEFLAAMAEHTLLVIRARDVTIGELKRAMSILEKLEPKALSLIVTNLEVYQGGGYFAQREKGYNASHEEAKRMVRSQTL